MMGFDVRPLAALSVTVGITAVVFMSARQRARRSRGARVRVMLGGVVGAALAATALLWLPQHFPRIPNPPR